MPRYEDVIRRVIPDVEFHQNRYARGLSEVVREGMRWLDIGAGTRIHHGWIGALPEQLAARAGIVVGCDMVGEHIARNASLSAAAIADATRLPFASASFDVVTANMVLEHLSDPQSAFAEVARVLRPGGKFLFVTPNRTHPAVWFASGMLSRPTRKALAQVVEARDPEHVFYTFYRANTPRDIDRLAAGAKLRVNVLDRFSSFPFLRSPWLLTLFESLWIRTLSFGPLQALRSNIFGELERPATQS